MTSDGSENHAHAPMPEKMEWRISGRRRLQYQHGHFYLAHKRFRPEGHYEWDSEHGTDVADVRVLHAVIGRFLEDYDAARAVTRAKRAAKKATEKQ